MKYYAFKDSINTSELKQFRLDHNLTRSQMADFLNISKRTLEKYETVEKEVSGCLVSLFRIIKEYPELIDKYKMPKQTYSLRLYYMENDDINTVIDVDVINRKVKFKNFTNNLLARAFGNKEEVTYEDYEEFLQSRCFPKTRDKMKIQLEMLGIPFYDPLLIIEKTSGKLADDNFYIKIERGIDND